MMTIKWTCSNEDCEHEFTVEVIAPRSHGNHGSFDDEPEWGEIDPLECPRCGKVVDTDWAFEKADER